GGDVIQVIKVPLEEDEDPPAQGAHWEKLYDGPDTELRATTTPEPVIRIAEAITQTLRRRRDACDKIYVTQIADESVKVPPWTILKRKLHEEGFDVLPKVILLARTPNHHLRNLLEKALLSVHLTGIPDDSMIRRQLEIARQVGKRML